MNQSTTANCCFGPVATIESWTNDSPVRASNRSGESSLDMRVADDRRVEGWVAPAARAGGARPLRAHPGFGEQAGTAGIERIEGIGDHEEEAEDRDAPMTKARAKRRQAPALTASSSEIGAHELAVGAGTQPYIGTSLPERDRHAPGGAEHDAVDAH